MPHRGPGNEAPLITIRLDQGPEGDERAGFDPPALGAGVVELLAPCSGPRGGVWENFLNWAVWRPSHCREAEPGAGKDFCPHPCTPAPSTGPGPLAPKSCSAPGLRVT